MDSYLMTPYLNRDSRSDIRAYKTVPDGLIVLYDNGWCYLFTEKSVGGDRLRDMIRMAESGQGLSTYILNSVVRRYEGKWRYVGDDI